jgi:hypothetical protein
MPTRSERRSCQALVSILLLLASSSAVANGRFPRAQRLLENPNDPDQLSLAATYGILTTQDRGRNWHYICEAAFAHTDVYTGDPLLDLAGDGALLVGVQSTLNVSRDRGCQWTPTIEGDGSTFVIDYSVVKLQPAMVVAVLATFENGTVEYWLARSIDNAATWTKIGGRLPVATVYTVDVDPTDSGIIYLTGIQNNAGQFLRSADGGMTFTTHAIPNTNISEPPYLAAIHPTDPRKIFIRTDAWVPVDGNLTANDALLYSSDGGETWAEVFRNRAKMFGFALAPDGSTVLIGFGDPLDGASQAVTGQLGVFKSAVGIFSFELVFTGHVTCLTWTKTGVYVCASQHFDGFEVAFSKALDFTLDAGCWTPLLRLNEVKGPLTCSNAGVKAICDAPWLAVCPTLGGCGDAGSTPSGCANGGGADGSSVDGRSDGGFSEGGGGASSGGPGGSGGGPSVALAGSNGSLGCGCRSARRSATFGMFGLAAGSLLWFCRRRQSRRKMREERWN